MQFLYLLESIRSPVPDIFFSVITHLGSETVFLAIAIIVYWCVDKLEGYYLLTVGFVGTILNQFLKLVCRVPRPWVRDPDFTIVEAARAEATGYSFPSGHTQSVTASLGCPARATHNPWVRAACILLILLTAFSRMYLGVHTPADVLVSLALGAVLVLALYPVFRKCRQDPDRIYLVVGAMALLALAFVLFLELFPWPADIDPANLAEGVKNGYLLLGCSVAMFIAYWVESNCICFSVKAPDGAQALKVVLGLALLLGLKAGLKPLFSALLGGHMAANALRYFCLVIFAVCVWPLTFKWFARGCPLSRRAKKTLRALAALLAAVVLLAGVLFWVVTRDTKAEPIPTDDAQNPLITPLGTTMLSGHRAGAGVAPENTMAALQYCVEGGQYRLDVFEFDIHLTADGVPVLLHDPTLDRTSNAAEHFGHEDVRADAKTLEELKELNMGEQFEDESGGRPYAGLRGEEIPRELRITTLREALEYLEANGEFHYIIEIKNQGDWGRRAVDVLYHTLGEFGCLERAVVGTFHNEVTAYMDETYPDLPRSAGMAECVRFYVYSLLNLPADRDTFGFVALQIPTTDYVVNLGTSRVVNYAHKHDIAVQYWTINDMEEAARLQSIGADAIMTDLPHEAAGVLVQPQPAGE